MTGPQINIKPETVACPVHGECFRLNWPAGYLGYSLRAFTLATTNRELWDAAQGDADRLDAAIAEFGPLCRLLTPEQRREAYAQGDKISEGWASHWICARHGSRGRGTWGLWSPPHGGEPVRHFLCFDCLADLPCA